MTTTKAKTETDSNGYPLSPVNVSEALWMYLDAKGATVVVRENGKTCMGEIPWRKLCEVVDLHRKLSK